MDRAKQERPGDGRIDVHLHADLKAELIRRAEKAGVPLGEMMVRLVCQQIDWPLSRGLKQRRPPGRKPSAVKGR